MSAQAEPKKTGQPAKAPGEKLEPTTIRVNQAQKAKLRRPGMQQRMRDWLDRVKE